MRVFFDDLQKELYLYKNRQIMVGTKDNKLKGNIIFPIVQSSSEIDDIYKSNLFVTQYIKGYYYPKRIRLASVRNKLIEDNQKAKYLELDTKYPKITYKKPRLSQYQSFNTIYDMNEMWKLFQKMYGKLSFNMKINKFKVFFGEVLNHVLSTDQRVISVIVPSKMITTGREDSFENYFYFLLRNDMMDIPKLDQISVIFTNKMASRFFVYKITSGKKETRELQRFRRFCNILYKMSYAIDDLTEDEIAEIDKDESNIKASNTLSKTEITNKINNIKQEIQNNKDLAKQVKSKKIANNVKKKIVDGLDLNKIGISKLSSDDLDVYDKLADKIDDASEEAENEEDVEDILNNDEEFLEDLENLKKSQTSNKSATVSQKRVEKLKAKQSELKIGNDTIDSIINEHKVDAIEKEEIKVDTINKEIKTSTLKDFDKSYVKNQKDKDMIKVLSAFNNDPDCPIFITDLKREDTSDDMNKKETLYITFEDGYGTKHKVRLDVPLVIDNSFMYLNNGKKSLTKQLTLLPITKTKADEVRITGKNKMFVYRFGRKLNVNTDKLKKFLMKDIASNYKDIKIIFGNNEGTNNKYFSIIEYDDLSTDIISIKVKNDYYLNFNRNDCNDEISTFMKNDNIEDVIKDNTFLLGGCKSKESYYLIDVDTNLINEVNLDGNVRVTYETIFDLILDIFKDYDQTLYKTLLSQKPSKKFMYTRTKIIGHYVPMGILMGFYFGLENVLQRYKIDYRFEEGKLKLSDEEISKYSVLQFKDGYLYYKSNPLRNSLLLNGLTEMPLREIEFSSLNSKEIYLDVFDMFYGSRNVSKGFKNDLDFLLDPITIDVLKSLDLPDNLLDVLLYANTLLEDNSYTDINNMKNYRIRSVEMLNTYLYNTLADSIKVYKDAYKSGHHEARIAVKQDAILKNILQDPIVDEYSTLNPILEVEKLGSTNYKGVGGVNLDSAFTPAMRAYDKSMVGLLGMSSPDSNKVGVVRQLSYSPKIMNTRGIIDTETGVNDLDATNIFTAGELISCYTSLHADPPRIGMQTQQARHTIPTEKQSRPLYGSGIEKTLPYMLSSDFVITADQDGVVEKIDEKNELAIIRYKDDSTDVIDLSSKQSKNSNGG